MSDDEIEKIKAIVECVFLCFMSGMRREETVEECCKRVGDEYKEDIEIAYEELSKEIPFIRLRRPLTNPSQP